MLVLHHFLVYGLDNLYMDNFNNRKFLIVPSYIMRQISLSDIHEECYTCITRLNEGKSLLVSYDERPPFYKEEYEEYSYEEMLNYFK
jgi:hypothetical protein